MGKWDERRALRHEDDEDRDSSLSLDVDEYLISNWPTLTATQRCSVWSIAQDNDDFDYSGVETELDKIIYKLADKDAGYVLPEDKKEEPYFEEEALLKAMAAYLVSEYEFSKEDADEISEEFLDTIEDCVNEVFYDDEDEDYDDDYDDEDMEGPEGEDEDE